MAFLNKEELSFVVNLAYELCSHGKVQQGMKAFLALNKVYPNNQVIEAGLGFSFLVVNEFAKADAIFDKLCAREDVFDEVLSFASLSKLLQNDTEAATQIASKMSEPNGAATALYQAALEAKSQQ